MELMSYEKLDVYQVSIQYFGCSIKIAKKIPHGNSDLVNQLKRASQSIPLNIAEGSGKRSKADSIKYFDIARGSAMECAAILDVASLMNMIEEQDKFEAKKLLHRIIGMLTKLSNLAIS